MGGGAGFWGWARAVEGKRAGLLAALEEAGVVLGLAFLAELRGAGVASTCSSSLPSSSSLPCSSSSLRSRWCS